MPACLSRPRPSAVRLASVVSVDREPVVEVGRRMIEEVRRR
jgi:hypothetical protein